ncbi:MAG: CAAX prenyl protease-related protein [Acidobacteriia bacterium]|nr:CAAX prenyl protease-related protein [Terriglobia bacterium]
MQPQAQSRWASLPYVLPFAVFMAFLAVQKYVALAPVVEYPARDVLLIAVLIVFSRKVIDLHSSHRLETAVIGVAVFVIWVGPDMLFPAYRQHWLFQNSITGELGNSVPESILLNPVVLWSRIFRAVVLVPIIEELFWRAWLMRWLISPRFEKVPLGAYQTAAFAIVAVMFAAEHGPFWDVGLVTGVIYNWWMVRTRSLGDCILVHAITNACLCGYVVATHHWEYW